MPETNNDADIIEESANTLEKAPGEKDLARRFSLLEEAAGGDDLTVRDDQYIFPWLLDAVKRTVRNGGRFRLVDSGALEQSQLEWLLDAGADFYTSDERARDIRELEALSLLCRQNHARLCCFIHSSPQEETQETEEQENAEEEQPAALDLQRLALTGSYLFFSNRKTEWGFAELIRLAEDCRRGGARLFYYHQGELPEESQGLAEAGAWIHVTQSVLNADAWIPLADMAAEAHNKGGGLIIHLQKEPDFLLLEEMFRAGAYVRFEYAQIHYRSPFKPIEQAAKKRQPDPYAFYLQKDFPA